ncbi:MAG: iron ABC transporter substrate-binding protein, partial [Chloroflexi bacterium]|nr:iron ABC transporter substrate-binding protein [Chloroflexota bacterium]
MRRWTALPGVLGLLAAVAITGCARPAQTTLTTVSPTPTTQTVTATAPTTTVTVVSTPTATPPKPQTLTIYSGRAESLVAPIIDQFNKATGVKVQVRYGGTAELAATILEEGQNSPADIFYAQDPAGLGAVSPRFATLSSDLIANVKPQFKASDGKWVGISGRARVVVYNTTKLAEADLPGDIWEFSDARWKGRLGWAPTNGSFQAMVTAMQVLWGDAKTKQWLTAMKANNPKIYSNNTGIVTAVGNGEIDAGFVNHYYLFSFLQGKGESFPARNYYVRGGGPGATILVSGAGIMETSKNKESAERFLSFMLSPVAQQYFAGQTYEYPVIDGVATHRILKPLA